MEDEPVQDDIRTRIEALARRLDIGERVAPYAAHLWSGRRAAAPVLHLDDVSGIPFVSLVPGVEEYQHRARVRAGDGDLVAAVTPPVDGFETYCQAHLGLGAPDFILAEAGEHGYAVATACQKGDAFASICEAARGAGRLVIHPYMSIEPVWELARRVAAVTGVPVEVIGPPPPVLWLANDKALFSEVVTRVLSADWIVETRTARDPVEMAEHLRRLARHHGTAGLKRTRCASAMGNAVYDLEKIKNLPPAAIVDEVRRFLERTEWAVDEEVLIVAWERTDDSPSTQLWIPPAGQGEPVVEGVYEQLLEGEERIFLGSRPSRLGTAVDEALAGASLRVATALQLMGYVGRCSFDFILVEDSRGGRRPRFTECNGRWGGTSTPMRLIDRVIPGKRPPYWAQDFMHHDLIGIGFPEILRRVGEALYDPRTGRGQYVFYNVGPLARSGKLDVVALAPSADEAERLMREDLPARLGVPPA